MLRPGTFIGSFPCIDPSRFVSIHKRSRIPPLPSRPRMVGPQSAIGPVLATDTDGGAPSASWMWPDEVLLESLDADLRSTEEFVDEARASMLAVWHDSLDEQALVVKKLREREARDAAVVAACDGLRAALDDAGRARDTGPDATRALPEFEALRALLPVPDGVLKPVRNQPAHRLLVNFLRAQRKRHEPDMARAAVIKAVRAQYSEEVDGGDELRAAREAALAKEREVVARSVGGLTWSDHVPIRATLRFRRAEDENGENDGAGPESTNIITVLGWNVLERKSNGVKPVLPLFRFWGNRNNTGAPAKKSRFKLPKNTTSRLQRALLDPAAVQAHADAVARWALDSLRGNDHAAPVDVVCLSEVGAPVADALWRAVAGWRETPSLSISSPTEHLTEHPQTTAAEACEGRTAVLAPAGSQILPDVRVRVGNKVRHLACVRLTRGRGNSDVVVVAVHVPRMAGCDSRCPRAGGGLGEAGRALRDLQVECRLPVFGVGDWNGNVALVPPGLHDDAAAGVAAVAAKPGRPTTFADTVIHPESNGIDGALALVAHDSSRDDGIDLTVEVL